MKVIPDSIKNKVKDTAEKLTGKNTDNGNTNRQDTKANSNQKTEDIGSQPEGGAHKDIKGRGAENRESHHMPADSVSPLSKDKGPAVSMEKSDHKKTASWGSSKEAKKYRAEQKKLIDKGEFKKAQDMDVKDTQSKFGDKYNEGIQKMQKYTDELDLDK